MRIFAKDKLNAIDRSSGDAHSGAGMKRSASEILLDAVDLVVGRNSDVARYLARAIKSDDPLDLLLAQAAFDELEGDVKRAVAREIETGARMSQRRPALPRMVA